MTVKSTDDTMFRTPHSFWPALLMLIVALSVSFASAPARAQDTSASGQVIVFNIPAEPLDKALRIYGHVADMQVLYDADLVHGQLSSPVKGAFHAREALELMLRGTGLRVRYSSATAITLAAVAQTSPQVLQMQSMRIEGTPEVLDGVKLSLYIDRVQSRILAAFYSNAATRRLAFDINLHVWLGRDGAVTRAELISSSVPPEQTRTILAVVSEVQGGEAPPPDLPQPVGFHFRARPTF